MSIIGLMLHFIALEFIKVLFCSSSLGKNPVRLEDILPFAGPIASNKKGLSPALR